MQCPNCNSELTATLYEEVNIHFCSGCKGRLLNEQKLNKIETSREKSFDQSKKHSKSKSFKGIRSCPSCNIQMEKVKHGQFIPKIIDKCPQCSNIWLYQGELEDIQVAHEMYEDNLNKRKKSAQSQNSPNAQKSQQTGFNCPKCGVAQTEGSECIQCGIIFSKYHAHMVQQSNHDSKTEEKMRLIDDAISGTTEIVIKRFKITNEYTIEAGGYYLNAYESNNGFAGLLNRRWFFGRAFAPHSSPFEINIWDWKKNHVLALKRPFRFYFHEVTVSDAKGKKLGTIIRDFSIIKRKYRVLNASGLQTTAIIGPIYRPWTFFVTRQGKEIGKITKKCSGLTNLFNSLWRFSSDADTLGIKFSKKLDRTSKYLLLGAVFLIDSVYFDKKPSKHSS